MEVRRQQQVDNKNRKQQPDGKVGQRLFHRTDLSPNSDLHSARLRPCAVDRGVQLARNAAQILSRDIRCERHHSLSVQSMVFANDGPVAHLSYVTHERMLSGSLRHRNMFYVLNRGHIGLRNLDLHLISDSRLWISPIVRRDETARGRGRKE